MKLSYREKIGLLVLTVAVIIIVFVAWPIKLIKADKKTHEAAQKKVETEYNDVENKINEIPAINTAITNLYNESKEYSKIFIESKENFEIDKYIEEIFNSEVFSNKGKNRIMVNGSFNIADASDEELEFYYYTPSVITYPILEAADINGNLLLTKDETLSKQVNNALAVSELEAQDVEQHILKVDAKFTKAALYELVDDLKNRDTGVRITGVTIEDSWYGLLDEKIPTDQKGYSEGTIEFCFYTMQQIAEPDLSE